MMKNVTKDKGDTGVAFVIADLTKQGIKIALPLSDHLPFDIIAVAPNGQLARLSVKHRRINPLGSIEVTTKSVYSNRSGCHIKHADKSWIDAVAMYCPDTGLCYYVPINALGSKRTFTLRILEPMTDREKAQISKMHFAKNYTNPALIWMAEGTGVQPVHDGSHRGHSLAN